MVGRGDDEDIGDAGVAELANGMEEHRLAADRQQVLIGRLRQRKKPRSVAASEDDAFHGLLPLSALRRRWMRDRCPTIKRACRAPA
jgi:hypothetical protein